MCGRLNTIMLIWTILTILNMNPALSYFADWGVLGARPQEPTCVKIPDDMSLCSGIGYDQMRLPNLLDHGSVQEAKQQSGSWVPLLNVRCHSDTQLFLCSLFTPVCLETAIYPCRSLCMAVRDACESRMLTYGYHWPDMLQCDNFPLDNDMCIKAIHSATPSPAGVPCEVCSPVDTWENIIDNFCRAEFVIRLKIKKQRKEKLMGRKPRVYKKADNDQAKLLRYPKISLTAGAKCCSMKESSKPYLIMGISQGKTLIPTFVMQWNRFKKLKYSIKKLQELNCSDPNIFTSSGLDSETPKPDNLEDSTDKKLKKRKKTKGKHSKGKGKKSKKKEIVKEEQEVSYIAPNSSLHYDVHPTIKDENVETKILKKVNKRKRKDSDSQSKKKKRDKDTEE